MKTISKIILILLALILALSVFAGCSSNEAEQFTSVPSTSSSSASGEVASQVAVIEASYSESDIDSSYEQSNATVIMMDDESTSIDGDGASYTDNAINITRAGTYVLSGSFEGQITVEATSVDEVQLILNGAEIINQSGSAIYVKQAEKVTITLAEGSTNYIEDGSNYSDVSDDAPDAAIYADDDLVFNGSGTLFVVGNYKHGIKCADDLVITSGILNVTAVNDGIRGKDSVSILDGNVTVNAGGDGITSTNADDSEKGWISVDGGTFNITADNNGFQAESALYVNSGNITVSAGQDTYHSNNDILVAGGTSLLDAADDGMHADNILQITNGNVDVVSDYEGIEGASVYISGGNIAIEAVDDGINAAGGSDSDISANDRFMEQSGDNVIIIEGGYVYVSIIGDEGDGLDSNGDIYIKDGTLLIDGGVSQRDAAIDINMGTFEYSGGTLASVGSTAMLVIPSTVNQPVMTILFDEYQDAGETIAVYDSDGNEILSFTPEKTYPVAMLSSPDMQVGETYTMTMDGKELFTIKLDDTTITVDENGNAAQVESNQRPGGNMPSQNQNGGMPRDGRGH